MRYTGAPNRKRNVGGNTYGGSAILRMLRGLPARTVEPSCARGCRDMANHLNYDLLSRLAEHRASALDEARAERHLENCGRCRSELEWLQRIRVAPHHDPDADSSGRAMHDWLLPSSL